MTYRSDIAFTPAVKAAQAERGSREAYEKRMSSHDWSNALPPALQDFVHARDSFYLATASADGQPYVQHRGGPPGFLVVRDPTTLAFADYSGNRQYISVGNLSENPRVALFLMDYPNRRRLKIWGRASVVERTDEGFGASYAAVLDASDGARIERILEIEIEAWDLNCPQHITPRYTVAQIEALTTP